MGLPFGWYRILYIITFIQKKGAAGCNQILLSYYPRGEINIQNKAASQQQEDADLCTRKKKATTTTMHKMPSTMHTVTTTMNTGQSTRFSNELMLELSMLKMLRQS